MRRWHSAFLLSIATFFFGGDVLAQNRTGPFAPPVGQSGTTAMDKDSSAFIAWAVSCDVRRGPQDTSDLSNGDASAGSPSNATGKADGSSVLSLGDHGHATLSFEEPLRNGPGPDFAVFENSFSDDFLELAFVEVSSNGTDFVRFPASSKTDTSSQVASFGSLDATNLYNLAGKYRGGYGTPFDLEELKDSAAVDVDSITQVRVVDVIGCIQEAYASYDKDGRPVNDPWPTAFASSGFDLDAVGAIHMQGNVAVEEAKREEPEIRYDPVQHSIIVEALEGERSLELYDLSGRLRYTHGSTRKERFVLDEPGMKGVHVLRVKNGDELYSRKLLIR